MKKMLFAWAFLMGSLFTLAQSSESWYKVYTGKAGNLVTTVHLHKAGNNYNGYAWFANNQTPMQLYSYAIPNTDSISMSGNMGAVSFLMTGILSGNSFTGNSQLIKEGTPPKQSGFQLQVSDDKNFSSFSYTCAEGKDSMPASYKNDSRFEYFSSSVWPIGNKPVDESLKKFIRSSLEIKTPIVEPGKFLNDAKNNAAKQWKGEYIKSGPKQTAEMGLSLSQREESEVLVMHENEKLISLAHYYFAEGGGAAHGNYSTSVATFNKQTGKQVRLTDVLNAEGIKRLPAILEQVARIMYDAKNNKPLDENGFLVKTIAPTDNMYVTGSGIGFLYAPYEIRSFSDGEINMLVPFTALKGWLLPGY